MKQMRKRPIFRMKKTRQSNELAMNATRKGKNLRLSRALGAAGLASRFASSHFDGLKE